MSLTSPFHRYLARLHADLKDLRDGDVADYIPELAKAAPDGFGISFATIDGEVYSVGDSETPFSIQSVSKPFAYGGALARLGPAKVLEKVGVEPTGEAFNSIVLDQKNNRPFNPMVNAGAIAIAAMTEGETQADRIAAMEALFSDFAGRPLGVDEAVLRSEAETGHRNRAIAYLMLNTGMIDRSPDEVLEIYFRQCALEITTVDLSLMGATLANGGINPRTGKRVLGPAEVRDVLTLMMSCGMYDYAGEWSYDVGLPAKSGVSGGILAILPGQLSVAIWSPPLDAIGNSVRGVAACERISKDFGLHLFMNAASVEEVIRRDTRADRQTSLKVRNPRDQDTLAAEGHRIALVEVQGALYFASCERMLRRLEAMREEVSYLVLDFRRLHSIDSAAYQFLAEFIASEPIDALKIAFAGIPDDKEEVARTLHRLAQESAVVIQPSIDTALEVFEDMLLEGVRSPFDFTRFALDSIELFDGLSRDEIQELQDRVQTVHYDPGDKIITSGAEGRWLFLIARGSVSVLVRRDGGPDMRAACLGPGQFFGEIAALGGGARTADVVADERVVCYCFSDVQLSALEESHPAIAARILRNMAKEFGNRMRRADALISSLQ